MDGMNSKGKGTVEVIGHKSRSLSAPVRAVHLYEVNLAVHLRVLSDAPKPRATVGIRDDS